MEQHKKSDPVVCQGKYGTSTVNTLHALTAREELHLSSQYLFFQRIELVVCATVEVLCFVTQCQDDCTACFLQHSQRHCTGCELVLFAMQRLPQSGNCIKLGIYVLLWHAKVERQIAASTQTFAS